MKFQQFGYLVILDLTLKIDGFTDNVSPFMANAGSSIALGSDFEEAFATVFGASFPKVKTLLANIAADQKPRTLFTKRINNTFYYFSVYKDHQHIHIKWEPQIQKNISTSHLSDVAFLLEKNKRIDWNLVCKAFSGIIKYDRVIVLQVHENGYSNVVAEDLTSKVPSLRNMEFSTAFMPRELTKYYERTSYSYLPDIDAEPQGLISAPGVDGYASVLTFPPDLHSSYFRAIGVKSAVFFPLYFNGKFWGLIIGHHHSSKQVDLHNQKLCAFIAQAAMSNYENQVKQGLLDVNERIKVVKNDMLEKLAKNKSYTWAIVEHIKDLCVMMRADGVAIYDDADTYTYGMTPDADLFYDLISYLQKSTNKTIFKDHNFKLNRQKHFTQQLPFAGMLAYNIDANKEYYILWFRKERLTKVTQVDMSEEGGQPKVSAFEKTVFHSATPWDDYDLTLLDDLRSLFSESMLYRNTESRKLNKELLALNNELEMLTHTISHDLKNPLSVLKMGLKYLEDSCASMSPEVRQKWYQNLSQSILHIEDILDNTIQVSSYKTKKIVKEPVPMNFLLRKIIEETRGVSQAPNCKVTYGKLMPIWGERSAVYQIFLNIINNAIKYSRDASQPAIHIKSIVEGDKIVYSVSDNGIGIPQTSIPRVLDMFVRADNAGQYPGTGIGLALVKRMIERMDGHIVITSQQNEGTTITMYFPVNQG